MYQTGGTIKDALEKIRDRRYALPAIQREFVWRPDQICRLFDSMMQGYPFGTFLFWQVEASKTKDYQFYQFMREYHERDHAHCDRLEEQEGPLTAVLDGQQRLTALNIGLRGSLALKLPGRWWNNDSAFPKKHLHLNLLRSSDADENGVRYEFDFLTLEEAGADKTKCWFKASEIMEMQAGTPMIVWLNERLPQHQVNDAFAVLDRLRCVVHTERMIAFYEEQSQQLDKVLNIFIRLNSGGTVLSYSDLLLSIAIAQWTQFDAREEIQAAVGEMNQTGEGFDFSKDLVLKAGLMLSDLRSVGFKVDNFNKANMAVLEGNWPKIRRTLLLTAQLVASFGFSGSSLRADSAILPIAYYLFRRDPGEAFLTHPTYEADRSAIRNWLIRSLLKTSGIWGSGLDTLLTALRGVIRDQGGSSFPYDAILVEMKDRSKSLDFSVGEVDELADMAYGDKRLFALLTLLFPFVRQGYTVHIDHIFPKAVFHKRKLERAGVSADEIEEFQRKADTLPNLQLLLGVVNNQKRAQPPLEWLQVHFGTEEQRAAYRNEHHLGQMTDDIREFPSFHSARREVLRERIGRLLGVSMIAEPLAAE